MEVFLSPGSVSTAVLTRPGCDPACADAVMNAKDVIEMHLASSVFIRIQKVSESTFSLVTDQHGQIALLFSKHAISTSLRDQGQVELRPGSYLLSTANNEFAIEQFTPAEHKLFMQFSFAERSPGQQLIDSLTASLGALKQRPLLLLSGGVDSLLLYAVLTRTEIEFDCATVSFDTVSPDQQVVNAFLDFAATQGAKRPHTAVLVSKEAFDGCRPLFERAASPNRLRVMDCNLMAVWHFGALAAQNELVISGLGPDEYLGGYKRISQCKTQEERLALIQTQIQNISERNVARDFRLASLDKKTFVYPYLDFATTQLFLGLPVEDAEEKKVIRDALRLLQIPEQFLSRKKQAAQFGSGAAKLLKKEGYDYL